MTAREQGLFPKADGQRVSLNRLPEDFTCPKGKECPHFVLIGIAGLLVGLSEKEVLEKFYCDTYLGTKLPLDEIMSFCVELRDKLGEQVRWARDGFSLGEKAALAESKDGRWADSAKLDKYGEEGQREILDRMKKVLFDVCNLKGGKLPSEATEVQKPEDLTDERTIETAESVLRTLVEQVAGEDHATVVGRFLEGGGVTLGELDTARAKHCEIAHQRLAF